MKTPRIVKLLLAALGYVWALVLVLAVPMFFITYDYTSGLTAELPFMKIHPRYSGGEILHTFETNDAIWKQYRPVFDGLVSERADGFVQIRLIDKKKSQGPAPHAFDINGDTIPDFILSANLSKEVPIEITELGSNVGKISEWAYVEDGIIIRIALSNQPILNKHN
jgi:hypothetical protein